MQMPLRGTVAALRVATASALLLAGAGAFAAGPVGPVGPVGTLGPSRPTAPVESPGAVAKRTPGKPTGVAGAMPPVARRDGVGAGIGDPPRTGNHIEVTGNTAAGAPCAQNGAVSVNSIDVSQARLDGKTVIVQGRNAQGVDARDCTPHTDGAAARPKPPGQVNSIRIR